MNNDTQKEALWDEIKAVIWNPYLRNDVRAWEYLFTESDHKTLFQDSGFRDEFILYLSLENGILNTETTRYITKRIDEIRNALTTEETNRVWWRKLLYFEPFRDILIFKKFCTKDEKKFYTELMGSHVEKLKENDYFKKFLKQYFQNISINKDTQEELYIKSIRARRKQSKNVIFGIAAVYAVIILMVALRIYLHYDLYRYYGKYSDMLEEKYSDFMDDSDITMEEIDEELDVVFDTYEEWYNENAEDILNNFNK